MLSGHVHHPEAWFHEEDGTIYLNPGCSRGSRIPHHILIDPDRFAGGSIQLDAGLSRQALDAHVGGKLELDTTMAAFGVSEVVEENMANAARVHAVENGKNISDNIMVAFGGAAPLHAARQ